MILIVGNVILYLVSGIKIHKNHSSHYFKLKTESSEIQSQDMSHEFKLLSTKKQNFLIGRRADRSANQKPGLWRNTD